MALAKGKSRVKCGPISLHTQTAIHIATQLTEVLQLLIILNKKGASVINVYKHNQNNILLSWKLIKTIFFIL